MSDKNVVTVSDSPVVTDSVIENPTVREPEPVVEPEPVKKVSAIIHGNLLIPQTGLTGKALARAKSFKEFYDDTDKVFDVTSYISNTCLKSAKNILSTLNRMVKDNNLDVDNSTFSGLKMKDGKGTKEVRVLTVAELIRAMELIISLNSDNTELANILVLPVDKKDDGPAEDVPLTLD